MRFNPKQKIYLICNTGALGDTCAVIPTAKVLAELGHIEKMFIDERFIDLYKLHIDNEYLINLKDAMTVIPKEEVTPDIPQHVISPEGHASFLSYPVIPSIPVVYSLNPRPTSIHCYMVDSFSMGICDAVLTPEQKSYPKVDINKLPENKVKSNNYIVLTYTATSKVKRMMPEVFNGLKEYFFSKGFDVVLLGKRDFVLKAGDKTIRPTTEGGDFTGCIDLIDQTTIPEALRVLNDAQLVIGLDNGLLHLAAQTDVKIVNGFTHACPESLVPYRHGILGWNMWAVEPDGECIYCRTTLFGTYGINFNECNILTNECTKSLTLDKWIPKIEQALKGDQQIYNKII